MRSCHKNKCILVSTLIELFMNDHLDGAQPSDIEQENSTKSSRGQLPRGN